MIAVPLHPAVVHFRTVFAAVLPAMAIGALRAIRRGPGQTACRNETHE